MSVEQTTGREKLLHSDVTDAVIGAAIAVHRALGPGLLESAYEACLAFELQRRGIECVRQVDLPVEDDGFKVDCGYRMDIVVASKVIVEVKATEELASIHEAQLNS